MPFLLLFISFLFAAPVKAPYVTVDLVSQYDSFSLNEDNYLAFTFELEPEWHIYWINPGDSGKEPKVTWIEKNDVSISPFLWPLPKLMPLETLMNYGYDGKMALPFLVTSTHIANNKLQLKGKLEWLVCRVECIPGKAELSIELPVSSTRNPSKDYNLIHESLSAIPLKDDQIKSSFELRNNEFIIQIEAPQKSIPDFDSIYFFASEGLQIAHAAKQEFTIKDKHIELKIKADENVNPEIQTLNGVLSIRPKNPNLGMVAYEVNIVKSATTSHASQSLFALLVFAFIGGLILNLMPCVFPVLSLKILGFVHQAQENPKSIRVHGWLYTLGVLSSFWILTLILLVLKSSGEAVGWGFQLQSPYFVLGMIFLFFFIGLNLLGFFEFGEKLIQVGGNIKAHGYFSSFQTGVLATIVATPCTAPFMGAAIGVAFTLPIFQTFLIFTSLALGLAVPYLLLSYFPQWLKLLPKPGVWMLRMKEFFAFPMFLTMLWLLWVFEQQVGAPAVFLTLLSFILVLFLFWFTKNHKKQKVILAILGTLACALPFFFITKTPTVSVAKDDVWESYSEEKLQTYLKEGKSVFIDFTASWCITCQVNKRLVLNTEDVQAFFKQNEIVLIKADWTNSDPSITKKLAEFDRNSVPLYVFYDRQSLAKEKRPVVLPEVLSKQMIYNLISAKEN